MGAGLLYIPAAAYYRGEQATLPVSGPCLSRRGANVGQKKKASPQFKTQYRWLGFHTHSI